jgi:hypothetical protein
MTEIDKISQDFLYRIQSERPWQSEIAIEVGAVQAWKTIARTLGVKVYHFPDKIINDWIGSTYSTIFIRCVFGGEIPSINAKEWNNAILSGVKRGREIWQENT